MHFQISIIELAIVYFRFLARSAIHCEHIEQYAIPITSEP